MASGLMNRVKRPDTWLHRPMLQNVKKVLANPEPSTHDPEWTTANSAAFSSRLPSRSSILNFAVAPSTRGDRGTDGRDHRLLFRQRRDFSHEKISNGDSDCCHHRRHCLGSPVTSASVAGWLGSGSSGRTYCRCGDRWHSLQRLWLRPRLRLLRRTGLRLLRRTGLRLLRRRLCPRVLRSRIRRRLLWSPLSASIRLLRWSSVLSRVLGRLVIEKRDF